MNKYGIHQPYWEKLCPIPPEAEGFFLKHDEMLAKRTWMIKGCKHGKVVQNDERINEFFYRPEVVFEVFV